MDRIITNVTFTDLHAIKILGSRLYESKSLYISTLRSLTLGEKEKNELNTKESCSKSGFGEIFDEATFITF